MESLMLLLVFVILTIGTVAYISYRAYHLGVEAGFKAGYGNALQDFLTQQAQAAEQQQIYEHQQKLAAAQHGDMEAGAIGFTLGDKQEAEED